MPSNIEIKARVTNPEDFAQRAQALADGPAEVLLQEDVFFPASNGRLKLRIFGHEEAANRGELIFYQRSNTTTSKQSTYRLVPTSEPQALREALGLALGELVVVRKRRRLFMAGQTRIHLDEVEGLGSFMELEVVLLTDQDPEEGHRIAADLQHRLGVTEKDLVAVAYADLLMSKVGD